MRNKIKRILKKIGGWFACKVGNHDYTCATDQGIKPTKEQLESGIAGFDDYARMYCARPGCKYVYKKRY